MTLDSIELLSNRLLIKRTATAETSSSGLVIPESLREVSLNGTVVKSGPGFTDDRGVLYPMTVKVGDLVLLPRTANTIISIDGVDYLLMYEQELLGILTT